MKPLIMKKIVATLAAILCLGFSQAQRVSTPYLGSVNGVTQLFVNNEPYFMFSGELHNSATGSIHAMRGIWSRMAQKNLNTVIAPISWELVEPEEGKFDFSLLDSMVIGVRNQNMKLVLIWFGSWKNAKSTYVPEWVKNDTKRFPLVTDKDGNKLNILSTLNENSLNADAKAFAKVMKHIREIDSKDQTVIMVQVENEIGILGADRDYTSAGNTAFQEQVPTELMNYLDKHKDELYPELKQVWADNGNKQKGTWEEVFGKGVSKLDGDWQTSFSNYTEELFMAWNYARYVGEIARKGKAEYPLPMFANAWLRQKKGPVPGLFPSGGPLPQVLDIWRAAAPSIDFIAPDIYAVKFFDWFASEFKRSGNPLFIPETMGGAAASARAFYAFGEYDLMGYSPFNIDGGGMFTIGDVNDNTIDKVYACLQALTPYLRKYVGTDAMSGILMETVKQESAQVDLGDYVVTARRNSNSNAFQTTGVDADIDGGKRDGAVGLIIFKLSNNEFIVAGGVGGVSITITKGQSNTWENIGFASVDQLDYESGKLLPHRLNGDETAMGGLVIKPGEVKAFKIKMYGY